MVDLLDALKGAVRSSFCGATDALDVGLGLGANLYDALGQSTAADAADAAAGLVGGANDLFCNRPPRDPSSEIAPPFQGGQCDDANYRVEVTVDWVNGSGQSQQTVTNNGATGPVRGLRQSGRQVFLDHKTSGDNNIVFNGPSGSSINSFSITGVTLLDPGTDNCGNPPNDYPDFQPGPLTTTPDVTFDDNGGGQTTISPEITFQPIVLGPGAELNVPFNVNFGPGSSLIGELNLTTGDINIGTGSGLPGAGSEPLELEPEVDPEEFGFTVIGVHVVASVDPDVTNATEIFQSGLNPNIFVPRLGHVAFKYLAPDGSIAWGTDYPVKGTDQIIWAPKGAIAVAGTPNVGTLWALNPIVILEQCEIGCPCG